MVYMPHPPHKNPITNAMKVSLHNLFQLRSLCLAVVVFGFFPHISVINESLFQQEMRFSFPLFLFAHRSPRPSSSSLLCILTSSPPVSGPPSPPLSTFLRRFRLRLFRAAPSDQRLETPEHLRILSAPENTSA